MSKKNNTTWILSITLISILTSMLFSFASSEALEGAGNVVAVLLLLLFIGLGILFDMLGVAVTCAREAPFHAMASHKEKGAAEAIWLLRRAERVSSIANDVVGDISGIVSGATAATLAGNLTRDFSLSGLVTGIVITGLVAGLTIGGKAVGKTLAVRRSTEIVYFAARGLALLPHGKKKRKR